MKRKHSYINDKIDVNINILIKMYTRKTTSMANQKWFTHECWWVGENSSLWDDFIDIRQGSIYDMMVTY